MQTFEPLWIVLVLTGAVPAWATCHVWYGRKLRKLAARVHKLYGDRETLQEQSKQARLQVGQLQQELAARARSDSALMHGRAGAAPAAAPPQPAQPASRSPLTIPGDLDFQASKLPVHGFADTQPFEEK